MSNTSQKTKKLTMLALLTAIVVVLQALAISIRFGVFTITLVLAPIIVGAALYGAAAGAWLGFVFGVVVVLTDAGPFLAVSVIGTIITCVSKGILSGLAAGGVYRLLEKKNGLVASICAGICAPVVNTGVFLIGCRLFFYETVAEWGAALGFENTFLYMIVSFVGINFLIELGINLVLSSAIVQLVRMGRKGSK